MGLGHYVLKQHTIDVGMHDMWIIHTFILEKMIEISSSVLRIGLQVRETDTIPNKEWRTVCAIIFQGKLKQFPISVELAVIKLAQGAYLL